MSDDVKQGIKISEADAAKLDPADQGEVSKDAPDQGDVTGQAMYWYPVSCPWCGYIQNCLVSGTHRRYYNCMNCGRPFNFHG